MGKDALKVLGRFCLAFGIILGVWLSQLNNPNAIGETIFTIFLLSFGAYHAGD